MSDIDISTLRSRRNSRSDSWGMDFPHLTADVGRVISSYARKRAWRSMTVSVCVTGEFIPRPPKSREEIEAEEAEIKLARMRWDTSEVGVLFGQFL